MGTAVLIMGKSGSGKSASMRTFTNSAQDICIINVLGKLLPFRSALKTHNTDDYSRIYKGISAVKANSIVIDDAGYLITNTFMRGHSTVGKGNDIYTFYNTIADNYWHLIQKIKTLPANKIVYFMMHEDKNDFGDIKPKTIGKLLDEKVCLEGMFTIAIRCKDKKFYTQATDGDIAKTPMGMFNEIEIDNDLKYVDATIREYYKEEMTT